MKISASIYSNNKEQPLEQLVRELDAHGIDMLHIDCADDEKVFDDIQQIRAISKTPIDLHIMSAEPEKYFPRIAELGIEQVSFQFENLKELPVLPQVTKTKFGLSITSSTPLLVFEPARDDYAFVVMMSTTPGKSGGVFNRDSFQRIVEFRKLYPKTDIHVDGGVNDQIAFILRLLGVKTIVSGSYLINHESLGKGMLSLHKAPNGQQQQAYTVADFATPIKNLPVIKHSQYNFKTVLETIERYGQGFVMLVDDAGKLWGVVTNADVRRGLLKHLNNLNDVASDNIVNKRPIYIAENESLSDMIRLLNNLNFIILFLPVVDEHNVLKGAVLLNHLTRV